MQDLPEELHSEARMLPRPGTPRAYLGGKVVLLELSSFPQVPGAHRVIQTPRPQLRTVVRDIYAAGTVCVALELPLKNKTTQIFKGNTGREHVGCFKGAGAWAL